MSKDAMNRHVYDYLHYLETHRVGTSVDYLDCLETRWISGAGGLLLGLDLTQADVQAEYSCLALDTLSTSLKLTTDGEFGAYAFEITVSSPCSV